METGVAAAVLCIAGAGVASQWLAWRFRLPAIVLLFGFGLVAGPGLQLIRPSAVAGSALKPLVGLAVAIVVFEGGLSLNFRDLRAAGEGILRLTAIALPINWILAALASHWIAGLAGGSRFCSARSPWSRGRRWCSRCCATFGCSGEPPPSSAGRRSSMTRSVRSSPH